MPKYVDGFVLPVPKDRLDDYQALAEAASKIWKEHGALEYWECVGDDLEVANDEGPRSFRDMTGAGDDETVFFSWSVFASREARDKANERIAADPRIMEIQPEVPIFDYKRMFFGGFRELTHA